MTTFSNAATYRHTRSYGTWRNEHFHSRSVVIWRIIFRI